jgi:hypothetical protein
VFGARGAWTIARSAGATASWSVRRSFAGRRSAWWETLDPSLLRHIAEGAVGLVPTRSLHASCVPAPSLVAIGVIGGVGIDEVCTVAPSQEVQTGTLSVRLRGVQIGEVSFRVGGDRCGGWRQICVKLSGRPGGVSRVAWQPRIATTTLTALCALGGSPCRSDCSGFVSRARVPVALARGPRPGRPVRARRSASSSSRSFWLDVTCEIPHRLLLQPVFVGSVGPGLVLGSTFHARLGDPVPSSPDLRSGPGGAGADRVGGRIATGELATDLPLDLGAPCGALAVGVSRGDASAGPLERARAAPVRADHRPGRVTSSPARPP